MSDTTGALTLRSRILAIFLGLILVIFAAIILAFNVLVDSYISSTARAQLAGVVATNPGTPEPGDNSSSEDWVGDLPDITHADPGPLDTRPGVFMMDEDYEAIILTGTSDEDTQIASEIAAGLKATGRAPADITDIPLLSHDNSYYVTCVLTDSGEYLVFYVTVTGLVNFAGSVNTRLLQILIAAIAITFVATFLITSRMTRPLAHLTDFARRLGQGDFSGDTRTFHDKEMAVLADTMNQAARHLATYDQDQKTFFQNASHELRTPLMAITCQAEGIAYGIMEPKEASGKILAETARLTDMVEELLSISRLDSITKEQATTPCDLPEILASLIEEQRKGAEGKGLAIELVCDDPDLIIHGNDKTLRGAFTNLLSNAIRYARHAVTLTCARGRDQVLITISDDGPGIHDEDLPHIFERFYKGQGGVHGIGLAIVKSVVDQHNAHIDVSTSPEGTSFTISFPTR